MAKRKSEGALATIAYVRGWRQTDDGRWFKRGVAGTFESVSEAFDSADTSEFDSTLSEINTIMKEG